jgi:mitochondrial chaperone BCS1
MHSVDDAYLQRLAAAVPRGSILLIEDIDCAFPSREDEDGEFGRDRRGAARPNPGFMGPMGVYGGSSSGVTLSGLLNVIDGVGSDDGRIFFATVRTS